MPFERPETPSTYALETKSKRTVTLKVWREQTNNIHPIQAPRTIDYYSVKFLEGTFWLSQAILAWY
jgi:hypothetical protein